MSFLSDREIYWTLFNFDLFYACISLISLNVLKKQISSGGTKHPIATAQRNVPTERTASWRTLLEEAPFNDYVRTHALSVLLLSKFPALRASGQR